MVGCPKRLSPGCLSFLLQAGAQPSADDATQWLAHSTCVQILISSLYILGPLTRLSVSFLLSKIPAWQVEKLEDRMAPQQVERGLIHN